MSELIRREDAIKAVEMFFKDAYIEDSGVHCTDMVYEINHIPAASPWHRVEDELPPPNKTVLVCKIWRDVNGEPHKVITMDSFTISPSDSVIAWMPFPEPPKEEKQC